MCYINNMGKCKNIECNNETEGKRVYCSLKCRNYYVNKYLRDYTKNGDGLSKKVKLEYENNPKFCLNCGDEIPYNKRENKFCSKSCSASHTNKGRKGEKRNFSKEGIENIKKVLYEKAICMSPETIEKNKKEYSNNPKLCVLCNAPIPYIKRNDYKKFCSIECRRVHDRKNMSEKSTYKSDAQFKFKLQDYPAEFDFKLIAEHGWYKPSNRGNNLNGVSRDHVLSLTDGFLLGIEPEIISHPANCMLMIHTENISKNKSSSITHDELLKLIEEWDKKY